MVGIALIVVIALGYQFNWSWTGLGSYTAPKKTLWDWLQLLIIPLVLALGGFMFNVLRDRTEHSIAEDSQRETALQAYFDKMSELLLSKPLHELAEDEEARQVARVRTLTVLRRLDTERKVSVLQFLQEAALINKDKPIVKLGGADFSRIIIRSFRFGGPKFVEVDLSEANFRGADLSGIFLTGAKLILTNFRDTQLTGAKLNEADLLQANLSGANLSGAWLHKCNLRGVYFSEADLRGADFYEADFGGANLRGADLRKANFSRAIIDKGQLEQAQSTQDIIPPDADFFTYP